MDPSSPTRRSRSWWAGNLNSAQDAQIEPDPAGASRPTPPSPHQSVQDACSEPDPPLCSPPPQLVACAEPDTAGAPLRSPPSYAPRIRHHPLAVCVEAVPLPSPPRPDPTGAALPSPPPPLSIAPRFKVLSLLDSDEDVPSASHSTGGILPLLDDGDSLASDSSGRSSGETDNEEEEECSTWNPYVTDSFGNPTAWRLSDLNAEFTKYIEGEASKPKEKKLTKDERLKVHSNRMERYMKFALQKYNGEEKLSEDMYYEFDKVQSQRMIVEGGYDNQLYYHFNFSATQAFSKTCLFFAEVSPGDGDSFDIICCKLLNEDDNGHCYGCKNARVHDLRHPACDNVYVGGHVDKKFPFMIDTESEDDSD